MEKMKRVFAWAGILIIAGLCLATFILGVFGGPETHDLFMVCLICTIVVPVLFYAMMLVARILQKRNENDDE